MGIRIYKIWYYLKRLKNKAQKVCSDTIEYSHKLECTF